MTEISRSDEKIDHYARSVAMWREAVSASRLAMGLVELSTTRFLELSRRASELLGITPERGPGLTYLSVAERPREASEIFRLARDGMLDGIWARRRYRRRDGSLVELESSGWVIRSQTGPDLGLWVSSETRSETVPAPVVEEIVASPSYHASPKVHEMRVTLDDRWRIARFSANAGTLLGQAPSQLLGSSIIELTHPDDLAALLFAFARATTKASTPVWVRLRHHAGDWQRIQVVSTVLEGDRTSPFAFVVAAEQEPGTPDAGAASELAGHLRRIADTIEAAGMLAPLVETADAFGLSALTELTPRQWEVVSRLVRGERVATIAAEMYLSQSTVRNHLSAIFHKVGVHSQQQLLALWRKGRRSSPSTKR